MCCLPLSYMSHSSVASERSASAAGRSVTVARLALRPLDASRTVVTPQKMACPLGAISLLGICMSGLVPQAALATNMSLESMPLEPPMSRRSLWLWHYRDDNEYYIFLNS